MAERIQSFFELIADSSVFEAAFKRAKAQAGEFAVAFKASADSVEADSNKMGIAIERGIASGSLSRNAANQMIAQRLAFYGGGAASAGGVEGSRGGGLGMNAGMFGLYAGLGAVGAVAGGAAILTQQITDYAQHAASVLRDAEAIGINAQQLQTWQAIAKIVGLDERSMTLDFERFAKNLADGAPALKATGLTLRDIGITSTDVGQAVLQLADYFHSHNDQAQKAAIASALFGRSGVELIPILDQGSSAMQQYEAHLQSMGALLSDSQLVMGARAQTAIQNLGTAFEAAKDRLLAAALPGFTAFFQQLTAMLTNDGQLWTTLARVVSEAVSFMVGIIAGLSGTSVDLSKPPADAAAAYEGLAGTANDAAAGVDGVARSTKSASDAIADQISALQEQKRAQDDLYSAQKQALQDQLDTLHDVTDSRRHQGEDIVTYERRLHELSLQDQIKAVDKQKTNYDRTVDDHIAALQREQQAVREASGAMGSSLAAGISSGMKLGLSAADQATVQLNQKFIDFGKKFGQTVKGWFTNPDKALTDTAELFGEILGSAIVTGIEKKVQKDFHLPNPTNPIDVGLWAAEQFAGHAGGYYGSQEHLAWISEGNKSEAVLPLSDPARSLAIMEQSGMAALARRTGGGVATGGTTINVTFTGPVADEMVANRVMTKLDREMRKRGFSASRGFGTG